LLTQDRLAFASRFPEALTQLLQGSTSTITRGETPPPRTQPPPSGPPATNDVRSLIERANQALADYRKLTSEGKLGEAGAKLDELKRALEEMNRTSPRQ